MRISREGNVVTLINVFETKPEQQQPPAREHGYPLPLPRVSSRRNDDKQKGARIVWQSPIASLLSCASITP